MLNKYMGYVSLLVAIFALGFQIGVKNTSNKYEEQIAGIYRDIEKSALQVDNKNKDISFVPVIVGKDLGNLQEKRNDKTNTVISGIDNGSVKLYDKSSASTGKNCDNASSARGDKEESSGTELSAETSKFLVELTGDADKANDALAACIKNYEDIMKIVNKENDEI